MTLMKTEKENTITVLKDLIETLKDGREGFKTAAEDAKDSELRALFTQFSDQRAQFVSELQSRLQLIGADADKSGSVSGSLHRGWIDLKAALSSNEPHAVLAECERGEDAALKAYREALDEPIDGTTREIVRRQSTVIKATHDKVKQLRDSVQYSRST
jgi:uncharacterized protein (TIGR02284 family)